MDYTLGRRGWFPAAASFSDMISHTSNFPLAYVYAIFLTLSGHLIGRKAYIRYATALYPNHYTCLVGPSALSHKSTAIALGLEAIESLEVPHIRSITTSQGLLTAMSNGGGTAMIVLDEMASFLAKKRQDFAADLLARIVELYACPRTAGNYTRYDPIEVDRCFLTILSGSTIEWLRASLSTSDLMAGFGNRMTFVVGTPRKETAWPKAPYWGTLDWAPLTVFEGQVRLDSDAHDIWTGHYERFIALQKRASPFIRILSERIPEKVLKAALVMSAWYGEHTINSDMISRAIDWGTYLQESINILSPAFEDPEKQVLAQLEGGAKARQALFRELAHSIPATRLRQAVDNLRWLGMLADEDGKIRRK